jgi:hypothetical protein
MTEPVNAFETALAQVREERRSFLRNLLVGSAFISSLPIVDTQALAGQAGENAKGVGKGKGKENKKGNNKKKKSSDELSLEAIEAKPEPERNQILNERAQRLSDERQ